jgi:thiol-disulfide isomerase/thioredoxin
MLLFSIPVAFAGTPETFDIQAELSRPGVKLLVVEFYATWCSKCMEAIPEWKALHAKYKKMGLRLIVVSADEDVCSKPLDWLPDDTFCDTNGILQRKLEVGDLPSSFLFSWEGNVAMRSHRVKPIEQAIQSYFRDTTYKIQVKIPEVIGDKYAIGSNETWVRDDVIAHLKQRSKFDVVTSSSRSDIPVTNDTCSTDFPANSVLRIRLIGDENGERFVSLQLEKDGCIHASAQESYAGKGYQEDKASLRAALKIAVDKILAKIITVNVADDVDAGVRVQTFRNRFDDDGSTIKNPVVDEQGYLAIESEPEGATVFVNGEEMGVTPFVKELMVGEYVVQVKSGALWIPARKRVKLSQDGVRLQMQLGPNYGVLKVDSNPSGAEIWLDGEPTGQTTPYTFPMKKAGDYSLVLKKKMYLSRTVPVQLGNGKTVTVDERLEANFGEIWVTSDPSGASILIDGHDSGETTPARISPVAVGSREILLQRNAYNDYQKLVNVERGQSTRIEATLTGQMGLLKIEAFVEKDGKQRPVLGATVSLNGVEVGQTPFKKQVLVGSYKVAVKSDDGNFEGDATVLEGQERRVKAVMKSGGLSDIEWVYSAPAKLNFARSETTVAQYRACVNAGMCSEPGDASSNRNCNWGSDRAESNPINCVDWNQATVFCEWVGGRLPNEDEWYAEASNGGTRPYAWGYQTVTCDYATWEDGNNTDGCGKNSTWPVCSKPRGNSISGLCDMSGNVWEWTSSLYKRGSSARVLRGGSWSDDDPGFLRVSSRVRLHAGRSSDIVVGFRCAHDDPNGAFTPPPVRKPVRRRRASSSSNTDNQSQSRSNSPPPTARPAQIGGKITKQNGFITGANMTYSLGKMKIVKAYETYDLKESGTYQMIGGSAFLGARIASFVGIKLGAGGGASLEHDTSYGNIFVKADFTVPFDYKESFGLTAGCGYDILIYSYQDENYIGVPFILVLPNTVNVGLFYRPANFIELSAAIGAKWYDPLNGTTEEEAQTVKDWEAGDGWPVNALDYIGMTAIFEISFII